MLLNYLKLAVRLLIRNPFFTFINVLGLSIGFASFFTLWQYSTAELKTDQHHKDFERIVRIGFNQRWDEPGNSGNLTFSGSPASLPPQLKNDFPEVESYVRICEQAGYFQNDLLENHGIQMVIAHREANGGQQIFKEAKSAYADRNLFEFFTIPLIYGDPETVLAGVNFVALSQSAAKKYFGIQNPVSEELSLNDSITLKVTGVFEDFPHNSRLNYDMIISNEGLLTKWSNVYWGATLNFVKLKQGTSISDFENKINRQKEKYFTNVIECKCNRIMFAQPLKEIAFSQGFIGDESFYQKPRTLLGMLAIVSVVILSMAWINYINLSVTRMSARMKEFATRRVNGATALDLVTQFITESLLINALAIGISLTIIQLIRQPLELVFQIHITEIWSTKIEVWGVLLLALVSGVLITGLYPAYVCIARQRRILFMMRSGRGNKNFVTSLLTTTQFTVAIVLISWVFIVYLQLNHILNKDMGLNQEGVVILEGAVVKPNHYERAAETFGNQLSNLPEIDGVTFSRYMVGVDGDKPGNLSIVGSNIQVAAFCNGVEENYIPFFGLKLLAGRNFMKDDRSDVIIISRKSADLLGFKNPDEAIGTKIFASTGNWAVIKEAEVIGVIEDYRLVPYFNYTSSNTVITEGKSGIFLTYKNKLFSELTLEHIALRLKIIDTDKAIGAIEPLFKKFFPGNIFEWRFLDEQINNAYAYEKIARNQILMFTLLAIGIACLGLVAMMTQRIIEKTKEIGIRKILGAKSIHIGQILINTLLIQFLAAASFGIPLAYYLGNEYLQKYSERIPLIWWYYLLPLGLLLIILFTTIASMLWRAVRTNPVDSLRYE